MEDTVEAVYENGMLRPIRPLEGIAEHSHVHIVVLDEIKPATPNPAGEHDKLELDELWPPTPMKFEDLVGGWPKDELNDGFEEEVNKWRESEKVRDLE